MEVIRIWVDTIPVYRVLPQTFAEGESVKLCLFLSGLSDNKENLFGSLGRSIARRGYMGVFMDHYGHGERAMRGATGPDSIQEEVRALARRIADTVFGNMYRYVWEILGNGMLDARRVIDYFCEKMPVSEVVMGGVSMGGDTSVATAGVDARIRRVLALITTPDWLRPGMCNLCTEEPMDPGYPDAKSQWYYDQFNPMTHLQRYARGVDILFACGKRTRISRRKTRSALSKTWAGLRPRPPRGCKSGGTETRDTACHREKIWNGCWTGSCCKVTCRTPKAEQKVSGAASFRRRPLIRRRAGIGFCRRGFYLFIYYMGGAAHIQEALRSRESLSLMTAMNSPLVGLSSGVNTR